ncbi:MAG TPA: tRNA pseudouridine(55) synthase TruB, partial [bacterium (Candidatus Stahlbacteria)]|nr:tRNA pseudouridine(55) synthase TruB [Candidatus Stahlbacteria bacterium]
MEGFLLVDKPSGLRSRAVVDHFRRIFKTRTGHAGTLDPLASGLLIILLGNGTKLSFLIQSLQKEYEGESKLGIISDSFDREGKTIEDRGEVAVPEELLIRSMDELTGRIEQIPPPFSAVKVRGMRSYKLARSGVMVKKRPRMVDVYRFQLLDYHPPFFRFRALVGKGCYIRSLIYDLGLRLGCGATLWNLRRIRIGPFNIRDAIGLKANPTPLPITHILEILPRIDVEPSVIDCLIHGKKVEGDYPDGELLYITDGKRKVIGRVKNHY